VIVRRGMGDQTADVMNLPLVGGLDTLGQQLVTAQVANQLAQAPPPSPFTDWLNNNGKTIALVAAGVFGLMLLSGGRRR
jgi:hypothetical protein